MQKPQEETPAEHGAAIQALIDAEVEKGPQKEGVRRLEMSGGIQLAAAKAVRALESIDAPTAEQEASASGQLTQYQERRISAFDQALKNADSPELVEQGLINPAIEAARAELGSTDDFKRVHADGRVQRLYELVDKDIRHAVVVSLQATLGRKLEAALDSENDPALVMKLTKMLDAVEKADRKAA